MGEKPLVMAKDDNILQNVKLGDVAKAAKHRTGSGSREMSRRGSFGGGSNVPPSPMMTPMADNDMTTDTDITEQPPTYTNIKVAFPGMRLELLNKHGLRKEDSIVQFELHQLTAGLQMVSTGDITITASMNGMVLTDTSVAGATYNGKPVVPEFNRLVVMAGNADGSKLPLDVKLVKKAADEAKDFPGSMHIDVQVCNILARAGPALLLLGPFFSSQAPTPKPAVALSAATTLDTSVQPDEFKSNSSTDAARVQTATITEEVETEEIAETDDMRKEVDALLMEAKMEQEITQEQPGTPMFINLAILNTQVQLITDRTLYAVWALALSTNVYLHLSMGSIPGTMRLELDVNDISSLPTFLQLENAPASSAPGLKRRTSQIVGLSTDVVTSASADIDTSMLPQVKMTCLIWRLLLQLHRLSLRRSIHPCVLIAILLHCALCAVA